MLNVDERKKTDRASEREDAHQAELSADARETSSVSAGHENSEAELCDAAEYSPPLADAEIPAPPAPPPYLAQEIKTRLRYEDPEVKRRAHMRMIGSPHFIASCAIILAGVVVTLGAIVHMNRAEPRGDYWAPAIVVSAGHAVILLADSDDPMREISIDEITDKLRRGLYRDSNTGLGNQSSVARAEAMNETGPVKRPAEDR